MSDDAVKPEFTTLGRLHRTAVADEDISRVLSNLGGKGGAANWALVVNDFRDSGERMSIIHMDGLTRNQVYCGLRGYLDRRSIKDIACTGLHREVVLVNKNLLPEKTKAKAK
jgi:hypothetical protein